MQFNSTSIRVNKDKSITVKSMHSYARGRNKMRMPAVRCENNSASISGHTSSGMRCAFAADCVAARHVNSRRAKPRAGGGKGRGGGEDTMKVETREFRALWRSIKMPLAKTCRRPARASEEGHISLATRPRFSPRRSVIVSLLSCLLLDRARSRFTARVLSFLTRSLDRQLFS